MSSSQRIRNNVIRFCALFAVLVCTALSLCAQSLDANTPAPVRSNSVDGRIAARDLGDSRMTHHYFAFTGTPGDVLITVQTQNLNGDIDVFTAGTLRPLLKITLYAESSAPVTKGIYLRQRQALVLRIEARSPNDDEGTYRLSFGGSFEPIIGGPDIAETETSEAPKSEPGRGTRRVSSVGARIAEPEPPPREVATATPEPTPEAKPAETPAREVEKPAETETVRPATRNPRGRRPPARRSSPRTTETARQPVEEPKPAEPKPEEPKRETPRRSGTRSTASTRSKPVEPKPEEPKPEPAPEVGPRLVIETSDGTLINRPMSGVKRVTVENGQVVIVGRDGKINRVLLSDILRMTISP
jgi:hypothetical protein